MRSLYTGLIGALVVLLLLAAYFQCSGLAEPRFRVRHVHSASRHLLGHKLTEYPYAAVKALYVGQSEACDQAADLAAARLSGRAISGIKPEEIVRVYTWAGFTEIEVELLAGR